MLSEVIKPQSRQDNSLTKDMQMIKIKRTMLKRDAQLGQLESVLTLYGYSNESKYLDGRF